MIWLVTDEYNDDDEPFRAFSTLKQVREAIGAKRLTKINDNRYSYTFRMSKERTVHILNVAGLVEFYDSEKAALEQINWLGVVDAVQKDKHYWSLVYNWCESELFDDRGADRALVKAADRESVKITGWENESIAIGDFWGRMLERFHLVFAPKKLANLGELANFLPLEKGAHA